MKKFLLLVGLIFSFTQLHANDDDIYLYPLHKMWDKGCSSELIYAKVDDVIPGAGRWKTVYFNVTYKIPSGLFSNGRKSLRVLMEVSKDGEHIKSIVRNSQGTIMCNSDTSNW